MLLDIALLIIATAVVLFLFRKVLRDSELWRATVTPLASIIGSGFLIVAPLLDSVVNGWAPLVIIIIVALAYGIGGVVRYNIRHLEPLLEQDKTSVSLFYMTRTSDLALVFAYIISVAFYLRLLASFLLRMVDMRHDLVADLLTTAILAFIGIIGLKRGLRALENLEEYAVNIKLGIIAALLLGLVWHDANWLLAGDQAYHFAKITDWPETLRVVAGILIIVQGFETSRYMGDEYDAETRVRTMRYAQLLSAAIYIIFVSLALPLLAGYAQEPDETAIIDLTERVANILPIMLIVAAVMSQFSAAVADTVGAGGLLYEASEKRLPLHYGYLMVTAVGIALVWVADIFEIIALASRAFAFYYLVQTIIAILVDRGREQGRIRNRLGFGLMALVLALVVVFAIPAD